MPTILPAIDGTTRPDFSIGVEATVASALRLNGQHGTGSVGDHNVIGSIEFFNASPGIVTSAIQAYQQDVFHDNGGLVIRTMTGDGAGGGDLADVVYITDLGFVGVGIVNPQRHVEAAGAFKSTSKTDSSGSSSLASLILGEDAGVDYLVLRRTETGNNLALDVWSGSDWLTPITVLSANGKAGFGGNTSPANSLSVTGSADFSTSMMIGCTSTAASLALGGNAVRVIQMERHTTANTAGNSLTIKAGGATSGATNKAGGDLILDAGISTGSATASRVRIRTCPAGSSGTSDNTLTDAVTVLGSGFVGLGTTAPGVDLEILKSVSGGNVSVRVRNDSNTANSHSRQILYVGGASAGDPYSVWGGLGLTPWAAGMRNFDNDSFYICYGNDLSVSPALKIDTSNNVSLSGQSAITFGSSRHTTANAAGNTLTVRAGGATPGATNKAGGTLTLQAGLGTGNAALAQFAIQSPGAKLASGTSDQALVNRIVGVKETTLVSGVAATVAALTVASGSQSSGTLFYEITAANGTDFIVASGFINFGVVNKGGTYTWSTLAAANEVSAKSTATVSISNTFTGSSGNLQLTSTITSSPTFGQTSFNVRTTLITNSSQAIAL